MWGDEDDLLLRRAVSLHGQSWSRIAASGMLPGRTPAAIRLRWEHLRDVVPLPPEDVPSALGLDSLGLRHGHRKAWPAFAGPVRGCGGRDRTGGRPWDYFVVRVHRPTAHDTYFLLGVP